MGTSPLESISYVLFGKSRRALLGLFFTRPDEWFHLRQIARLAGTGLGAVQREAAQLAGAGILERSARGNQVLYRADP
jgi:hypothetical protein